MAGKNPLMAEVAEEAVEEVSAQETPSPTERQVYFSAKVVSIYQAY